MWRVVAFLETSFLFFLLLRNARRERASKQNLKADLEITERNIAEQKLKQVQRSLEKLTSRLIRFQDEERRHIARELHDDIAQRLSLLMMQLDLINRELPSASSESRALANTLMGLDELTRDVHALSHQLYSSKLQYIGLKSALRELCRQFTTQHGTAIVEMLEDVPDLPADVQLCFYRVAQEALNNIGKHSHARQASVQFGAKSDSIILEITDSGIGFESTVPVDGLGIASMRERLRMAGGDLTITSKPGQGTKLAAIIPSKKGTTLKKVA